MPPDPGAMDAALAQLLSGDAALMALCPGGVYYGVAPQQNDPTGDRVVVFVLEDHQATPMFGGRAFEEFTYLVQAVVPGSAVDVVRQANARIAALLMPDSGLPALNPAGYLVSNVEQKYDRPTPELDAQNLDARWQQQGGHYAILAQPN